MTAALSKRTSRSVVVALALTACQSHKGTANDARAIDVAITDVGIDGPPACTPVHGENVTFRKIATVPGIALLVTSPPGDPRLFVVEQHGLIHIIDNGQVLPAPFLDLSSTNGGPVDDQTSEEAGLLGLAFDPSYATTGELYVWYTTLLFGPGDNDPADTMARFHVSADRNVADPTNTLVLQLPRSRPNHNGGMLEFGSDGDLYVGTGDGGSHGDPFRYAQDPHSLFGKMLRIDVDHRPADEQYAIPTDNPYADGLNGAPEVLDLGLRNPWRWSFDRATGDMWIADVGQAATEEINVLLTGDQSNRNLGWSMYEGLACCQTQADLCTQDAPQQTCDPTGKTFALDNRSHTDGWAAIIGGQVYRGACYPDLVGWYFYTDNVRGGLYKARLKSDNTLEIVDLVGSFPTGPTSLHADAFGELYETDIEGNVWHLEASP